MKNKKISKNLKQLLRKEADKLWWEAVIKKFGKRCVICGKPAIDCHHFFPKRLYPAVRFEIDNGVPLCRGCHFAHHFKGDPTIHKKIIEQRGKKWYDRIEKKAKEPRSSYLSIEWYKKNVESLKKYLENRKTHDVT